MEIIFGVILGAIVLTLLVVAHELGHAITARRNGVVVEEFGIGFPPRAWSKMLKNGVLFSLNWLPIGGFVKLQGEHDAADKKGDYGAASFWQKTKILLAGVFMNWLAAAVLLTVLAAVGMPKILPNQFHVPQDVVSDVQPVQISYIAEGSPADKSGLKTGDKIIRFAGDKIDSSTKLAEKTKQHRGESVEIIYLRNGSESKTDTILNKSNRDAAGYLGVGSMQRETLRSTWSSPLVGVVTATQFTGATIVGLGDLLGGALHGAVAQFSADQTTQEKARTDLETAGNGVTGPVGIFGLIFPAALKGGLGDIIFLSAIISISLAVMNLLPIPALDGGRWFVTAVFKVLKKPLTKDLEEKIHGTGFLFLLGLIVLVTVSDIGKIIQ